MMLSPVLCCHVFCTFVWNNNLQTESYLRIQLSYCESGEEFKIIHLWFLKWIKLFLMYNNFHYDVLKKFPQVEWMYFKRSQSRYFELFWASTKLPLYWRKPENNTFQREKNIKEMILHHKRTRMVKVQLTPKYFFV